MYASTQKLEGKAAWFPHTAVEKTMWKIFRRGALWPAIKMRNETRALLMNIQKDVAVYLQKLDEIDQQIEITHQK